jgi:hypothetical protein
MDVDETVDDVERLKYKYPYFIFKKKTIKWKNLIPSLRGLSKPGLVYELASKRSITYIDKKILTTFPIPSNYSGSNIKKIKYNNEEIIFPDYGEYYIHTNFSSFKILLLDELASQTDIILNIFKFISGNCIHCDSNSFRLGEYFENITVENLYQLLFSTDQPLKLRCGGITTVLEHFLIREGFQTQIIRLNSHVLLQVYFTEYKKYGLLDPTYGVILTDCDKNIISIRDVFELIKKNPKKIKYKKLVTKYNLKNVYTQDPDINSKFEWTSDFSWSPSKDSIIKVVSPVLSFFKFKTSYLNVFLNYCKNVTNVDINY